MKNIILLSIMPQYVCKILNGTKKYEYRRSIPKNNFDTILIYSTCPDKKIVAYVEVKDKIYMNLNDLWKRTSNYSGIAKNDFFKYFKGKKYGYAYALGKVHKVDNVKISELGIKHPPQNFIYMSINKIKKAGIVF